MSERLVFDLTDVQTPPARDGATWPSPPHADPAAPARTPLAPAGQPEDFLPAEDAAAVLARHTDDPAERAADGPAERPEPPSLGEAVRTARQAAGLTVEQVSSRTKIRVAVLLDLEAGSTARTGGAAYARGHLRAVAAVTGTDPEVLLAAHERAVAHERTVSDGRTAGDQRTVAHGRFVVHGRPTGERSPATASGSHLVADRAVFRRQPALRGGPGPLGLPTPARERRGPRWGIAAAGALLVLSVLLLVGSWSGGSSPPVPAPGPVTAGGQVAPPAAAAVPAPGAALRLRVTGSPSWISVLDAGGATLYRGVLGSGTAKEFRDPAALQVTVGNAGAVVVECAGHDTAPGSRGQVRRYTCAPTGLTPA